MFSKDSSFKNFFNGFGYPGYQARDRYISCTYPQSGFWIEDGKFILSRIGSVKIIQHREIEGEIKTCQKRHVRVVSAEP